MAAIVALGLEGPVLADSGLVQCTMPCLLYPGADCPTAQRHVCNVPANGVLNVFTERVLELVDHLTGRVGGETLGNWLKSCDSWTGGVMRALGLLAVLVCAVAHGEIAPEQVSQESLGAPADTWFLVKGTMGAGFIFDAADGEMVGTLSLSPFTPTVKRNDVRNEIYAAERYYERGDRGKRNDVLTIYDHATLSAIHEIDIPDKIGSLNFPEYLSLLAGRQFLTIFNMTPAQSVSVVDVQNRQFVAEISTPGCALTFSAGARGFLMLCGDGTLQLIQLDATGQESERMRSKRFFSVEEDPVFDQPVATPAGWQLVSFEANVFEVTVHDKRISVSKPWSLLADADREEGWRVGGGQIISVHHDLDLLLFRADFRDRTGEVGKGTARDPYGFALLEGKLRLRLCGLRLPDHPSHIIIRNRSGLGTRSYEAGDTSGVSDEVPEFVVECHLHQDVAR